MKRSLRAIPAVEKLLQALGSQDLPRPTLVAIVRREVAGLRRQKLIPPFEEVVDQLRQRANASRRSRIQPVINGTGVLIHTNLGRSPLGRSAVEALTAAASNFNNLEFDLIKGERGSRGDYVEYNLALLCGAQAATVVNNCAAALVLVLRHFVQPDKDEVIISRGELIQIGGGFRIPEILEASSAKLREVGTTNKTSLSDYAKAIGKRTALILKVHHSNFYMGGFVESPATGEISALARKKRIAFVEDLGSGAVVATEKLSGVEHEPTPAEILKSGVDLVTFSGDKLLGGPQAGIIAGSAKVIERLKREPFFRALRCDKLVLSALQATVDVYLRGQEHELPVIKMLSASIEQLRSRAEQISGILVAKTKLACRVGDSKSQIGGGTLPKSAVSSVTLDFSVPDPKAFGARLRSASPPVIGYVAGRLFKIDLRTVFPEQDEVLVNALRAAEP